MKYFVKFQNFQAPNSKNVIYLKNHSGIFLIRNTNTFLIAAGIEDESLENNKIRLGPSIKDYFKLKNNDQLDVELSRHDRKIADMIAIDGKFSSRFINFIKSMDYVTVGLHFDGCTIEHINGDFTVFDDLYGIVYQITEDTRIFYTTMSNYEYDFPYRREKMEKILLPTLFYSCIISDYQIRSYKCLGVVEANGMFTDQLFKKICCDWGVNCIPFSKRLDFTSLEAFFAYCEQLFPCVILLYGSSKVDEDFWVKFREFTLKIESSKRKFGCCFVLFTSNKDKLDQLKSSGKIDHILFVKLLDYAEAGAVLKLIMSRVPNNISFAELNELQKVFSGKSILDIENFIRKIVHSKIYKCIKQKTLNRSLNPSISGKFKTDSRRKQSLADSLSHLSLENYSAVAQTTPQLSIADNSSNITNRFTKTTDSAHYDKTENFGGSKSPKKAQKDTKCFHKKEFTSDQNSELSDSQNGFNSLHVLRNSVTSPHHFSDSHFGNIFGGANPKKESKYTISFDKRESNDVIEDQAVPESQICTKEFHGGQNSVHRPENNSRKKQRNKSYKKYQKNHDFSQSINDNHDNRSQNNITTLTENLLDFDSVNGHLQNFKEDLNPRSGQARKTTSNSYLQSKEPIRNRNSQQNNSVFDQKSCFKEPEKDLTENIDDFNASNRHCRNKELKNNTPDNSCDKSKNNKRDKPPNNSKSAFKNQNSDSDPNRNPEPSVSKNSSTLQISTVRKPGPNKHDDSRNSTKRNNNAQQIDNHISDISYVNSENGSFSKIMSKKTTEDDPDQRSKTFQNTYSKIYDENKESTSVSSQGHRSVAEEVRSTKDMNSIVNQQNISTCTDSFTCKSLSKEVALSSAQNDDLSHSEGSRLHKPSHVGDSQEMTRYLGDTRTIEHPQSISIFNDFSDSHDLIKSSLVLTFADFRKITAKYIKSAQNSLIERSRLTFNDIGGYEDIKKTIIEAVMWPIIHKDIFKSLNIPSEKGIILYGPPGCSKTLFAKAISNEADMNFISIKGPEIERKYVGETERVIRDIFDKAKQTKPSIVFIDEIDCITSTRKDDSHQHSTKVLSAFLTELDGLEEMSGVLVLGATNRIDMIDPAFLRPGRINKKIYIGLPDKSAREKILRLKMRHLNGSISLDYSELADLSDGLSGAEITCACNDAAMALCRSVIEAQKEPVIAQNLIVDHIKSIINMKTK